jgi:hypothetical protein
MNTSSVFFQAIKGTQDAALVGAIRTLEDAARKPVAVTPAYPDALGPQIDSIPKGVAFVMEDSNSPCRLTGHRLYEQTMWAFESILKPTKQHLTEMFAWEVIRV